MPAIGTDEWIAELDRACAAAGLAAPEELVVQQELTGTDRSWHLVLGPSGVRARPGRHPAPDVTLAQDVATAEAVQRGEVSAQQAFMDGRLRVRGAVGRLAAAADAVGSLPGVPAGA